MSFICDWPGLQLCVGVSGLGGSLCLVFALDQCKRCFTVLSLHSLIWTSLGSVCVTRFVCHQGILNRTDLSYNFATGGILVRSAMSQRAYVMHCTYFKFDFVPAYTTDTLGSIAYNCVVWLQLNEFSQFTSSRFEDRIIAPFVSMGFATVYTFHMKCTYL